MKRRLLTAFFFIFGITGCTHTQTVSSYAEDRAKIINLQHRYLFALDFGDAKTYASTFAEDGVLNWARGEIVGRKSIYEFIASGMYDPTRNAEKGNWPAASRHFVTNQVIKIDGDSAKAVTYWFQATNPDANRRTMKLGLFGHYEDELVKIEGQWYFKYRKIYNEGLKGRAKAGMPNPAW